MKSREVTTRGVGGFVFLLLTPHFCSAQNDPATGPFKQVLNSKGYILISPAESWPYPGGLLVAKGKQPAHFVDLPSGITRPSPQSPSDTLDFPATTLKKQFSLKVVLTGLSAILGGNPGFGVGSNNTLNFAELKAQAQRITFEDAKRVANAALQSAELKDDLSRWLADKNTQVFVVGVVAFTTDFSVSANKQFNLDLSYNGSPTSTCPSDSSSGQKNDKSTQSTPKKSTQDSTKTTSVSKNTKTQTKSTSSPSTSASGPGGELHICYSKESTLSMKTDKALAFAAGAYKIVKNASDGVELEPIFSITRTGQAESTSHQQRAAAISSHWIPSKPK